MKTLSLCLIVKNEEKTLPRAIKNASIYADEIIIVDTGSTDKTKDIAKQFTDKVYDFEWVDDFSKARNFAFDKAKSDFLMWLDADDEVPDSSAQKIKEWKESDDNNDVLFCLYALSFDENGKPTFQYFRERIVKNILLHRWHDRVHETITCTGKITYRQDIVVHHKKERSTPGRNLKIYLKMKEEGEKFSPRNQFYFGRELFSNNMIDEAIHELSKFLSEKKGWLQNNIEACLTLSKCYSTKGEYDHALSALFGSFVFATPKGEVLYEIGDIFLKMEEIDNAIYWFELALSSKPDVQSGAFIDNDCYGFLPALALTYCYYKKGDLAKSYHFHQMTKAFKPNHEKVLYNEKVFENLIKK